MRHDTDTLRHFLDLIASRPNLSAAARAIDVSEGTIFNWLKKSAAGDERFLVDWPEGDEPVQFVEGVKLARKRFTVLFESQMRSEVVHGIPRTSLKDGEIIWARDPVLEADALDPERWALLHGTRPISDTYQRDALGGLVPLVIHDAAPAHLKIHVSRSLMPQTYGDHRSVSVDARVQSSVMIVGRQAPLPRTIEHDPPRRQIVDALAGLEGRDNVSPLVKDLRERLQAKLAAGPQEHRGAHNERLLPPAVPVIRDLPDDQPDDQPLQRPQAPMAPAPQPAAQPVKTRPAFAADRASERYDAEGVGTGPDPSRRGGAQGFKLA